MADLQSLLAALRGKAEAAPADRYWAQDGSLVFLGVKDGFAVSSCHKSFELAAHIVAFQPAMALRLLAVVEAAHAVSVANEKQFMTAMANLHQRLAALEAPNG